MESNRNISDKAENLQFKVEEMELTIKQLKKQIRKLDFSVNSLQNDKAITVNFLNSTIQDLEDANDKLKIYQQQELDKKDRTIQSQEIQLKQITDAMPSSMSFIDKDFKYQISNKSYFNWFGINTSSLIGKHIKDVHGDEMFKKTKPSMERVLKGERISYESQAIDKKGEYIYFQFHQIPAYDINNEIIGLYIYGENITQIKKNEFAIEEKNKELKKYIESNLQLENFAYLASHDLRSPLNNVLNFTKLLSKTAANKLDEREKKFLHFIDEGSTRMQQFIQDLLAYSLSSNKAVTFEKIYVYEILDEILIDISTDLTINKAEVLRLDLPMKIRGDKILIKQLFQNLISNANKFYAKENNPKIEIGYQEELENHLFYVKDNGIGIDKQSQEYIFGIFKRLHLKSEYEGTGIGLSTCKNAVEKHGGKIWLESEVNKGTTFYFTIPKHL